MYGGAGGEVLYRPFGKRFAIGLESWLALKRDPNSSLNNGFTGDSLLSGHVNGWYSFPKDALTVQASFGRYLAEDIGGSLSMRKSFKNGAALEGFITVTDNADYDVFGGTTHAYHGVRLSLPLGNVKYIPEGSAATFDFSPLGRDTGQRIDAPLPLYETTERLSYEHIANHWRDILGPAPQ